HRPWRSAGVWRPGQAVFHDACQDRVRSGQQCHRSGQQQLTAAYARMESRWTEPLAQDIIGCTNFDFIGSHWAPPRQERLSCSYNATHPRKGGSAIRQKLPSARGFAMSPTVRLGGDMVRPKTELYL